jgi:hypothetical protein
MLSLCIFSGCFLYVYFQDAQDSPKDVSGSLVGGGIGNIGALDSASDLHNKSDHTSKGKPSRHLLYTNHFPLPQVIKLL